MKRKTVEELLEICRANSGEYIPNGHPMTTFATTYSNKFVEAATELYRKFEEQDRFKATLRLYVAFRDANIPSCRGGAMTFDKTDYLVKHRIKSLLYQRAKAI